MTQKNPHQETIRRAALPEVMFAQDIGLALGIPPPEAEARASRGELGRQLFVGGRVALLREDFLTYLAQQAASPRRREKEVLR